MKSRVLLISSVHPPTDPRIVYKTGPALLEDYEVFCALPGARANDFVPEIRMISLPHFDNLLFRLLFTHPLILWKCLKLRPAIVHIFVPELIPVAFVFHWLGAVVIYEVQENMYKKFEIKRTNNASVFQSLFRYFDRAARKKFHFIFTEKSYLREYSDLIYPGVVVQNYVSLPFIDRYSNDTDSVSTIPVFFYCGVISMERAFDTLVAALVKLKKLYPDFHVHLFGPMRFSSVEAENLSGYRTIKKHLTFHGYTNLKNVLGYARKSWAGIALLKPVADYPESYPTKLFEYMALNLPVITSDFPLYRAIVERAQCGFCISPYDADELCETLHWIIRHPELANSKGHKGRIAAEQYYNWDSEQKTLLALYKKILVTKSKNI